MTAEDPTSDGRNGPPSPGAPHLSTAIEPGQRPSEAIVRAVGALTDTPVLELSPLYDTIDPGHLDGLFEHDPDGNPVTTLSFEYESCVVTVTREAIRVHTMATPASDR